MQYAKMNDVTRAKLMLNILEKKGSVDIYDIMLQFDISYTRAHPIFKLLRRLCEAQEICYYDKDEHKLVYVPPAKNEEPPAGQPAEKEEEPQGQQRSIDEVSPEELLNDAKPAKMLPDVADRRGTVVIKSDEEDGQ